jgi:hypothetical protein
MFETFDAAADVIKKLDGEIEEVAEQLESFRRWLDGKSHVFDANVHKYAPNILDKPSVVIHEILFPQTQG